MAPKKVETITTADIPDQPPTIDSDGFMDDVLAKARAGNAVAVEHQIALALSMEPHRCDLRRGVIVDFHVEFVLFASTQGYGPKKTLHVLHFLNSVRKSIEDNHGDDTEARQMLKQFAVSNAERHARDALPPAEPDAHAAEAAAAAATAASAAAAVKKDPKANAKGKPEEPAVLSARLISQENTNISSTELAPLITFVVRGMFQHAKLYAFVARQERPQGQHSPTTFTFSVETPMRAPPLSKAQTSAEVEAQLKSLEAKAAEELQRLQSEEAAALEAQRVAEENRKAQEKLAAEEERANMLYFSKVGSAQAVEKVQAEVESQLSQRQREILARVARLENEVAQMGK